MPLVDLRAAAIASSKGRLKTSGYFKVAYRDAKGRSFDALVIGPGTTSGLKLDLGAHVNTRIIDNVAVASTVKSTNAYFSRK